MDLPAKKGLVLGRYEGQKIVILCNGQTLVVEILPFKHSSQVRLAFSGERDQFTIIRHEMLEEARAEQAT